MVFPMIFRFLSSFQLMLAQGLQGARLRFERLWSVLYLEVLPVSTGLLLVGGIDYLLEQQQAVTRRSLSSRGERVAG